MDMRVVIEVVAMGMDAVYAARRAAGYAQGLDEVDAYRPVCALDHELQQFAVSPKPGPQYLRDRKGDMNMTDGFENTRTLLLDGRNIEKNVIACQESKHTTCCGPLGMMAVEGKRGSVQGASGSRRERGEGRNCLDSDKGVPEDERPGNLGFFSSPTREGEAGRSHLGRQEAARRNHRCKRHQEGNGLWVAGVGWPTRGRLR